MPDTAQKRTRASHYRATFRAGMPLRTLTIVRRSASHAVPDALRPLATQSVATCIPTLERAER
ncbi:hypothetical protein BKM19_022310 [Pseudomonas amygdali pv. morsprunorum]|nr:hypothetical protein BKM19_022310 [Pseudomonas amygdali pv. morsprunorum]POP94494.1 hypothetical protein CXB39_10755 [Pseudomonas amygdali pv. morsprunorum]